MGYTERTLKFHELYRSKIAPIFERYEVERKIELAKFLSCVIFAVFCFVAPFLPLIFPAFQYNIDSTPMWALVLFSPIIFMIVGVVIIFLCKDIPKNFAMKLKKGCLPYVLKLFDDIKWQNNKNVITDGKLNGSGLFGDFTSRCRDDEFIGSYKGVLYKICETEMLYESGSGKNRTCIPVFKGVVISFKSNKTIKNRTMIATKGDITQKNTYWLYLAPLIWLVIRGILEGWGLPIILAMVGLFALITYFICKGREDEPLNEVTLEDPRFCDKFNAYSSDQVEARYLLTTAFIERFQNLKTAFGAKKAKCSFFGDEIMIAISTNKNLFEVGSLFKNLNNPESINGFYNELSSIYNMVEYFKLDEKIGI